MPSTSMGTYEIGAWYLAPVNVRVADLYIKKCMLVHLVEYHIQTVGHVCISIAVVLYRRMASHIWLF